MMNWLRKIGCRFLGMRFVILTDFEGEQRVRRVRHEGGHPYAQWMEFGIHPVQLLDEGKTPRGDYVEAWEPFDPWAPKQWPKFSTVQPVPFRVIK